ncbi:MAG: fibronectin type III-like domain-contianing protein, partial [Clostridia bacterium]|nr:fibronectin type III-like domain-contianing protein [Clostridia bacterium]
QDDPSIVRPIKELKGFEKVEIQPGETKTVTIHLDDRAFKHYNLSVRDWVAEPDTYHIHIGSSSQDIRATVDLVYDNDMGYTLLREQWGNESQVIMA